MSVVYLTADWHLGHASVARWREQDTTPCVPREWQADFILDTYREIVRPRDVVWFLGDIIMDKRYLPIVAGLPGTKHLIIGNHDVLPDRLCDKITVRDLCDVFTHISGLVRYKDTWLSHAPMHPSELRGKVNIHGHTHNVNVDDIRYINISLEQTGYKPLSFQKLRPRIDAAKLLNQT